MGILVFKVFGCVWIFVVGIGVIVGLIIVMCSGVLLLIGLFGFLVLVIVLMGGLDSFVGVLIVVFCVGVLEVMVQWKFGGEWVVVLFYIVVFIVILICFYGLFG